MLPGKNDNKKMQVLSTKILDQDQRNMLRDTGIQLTEYNCIRIRKLNFKLPDNLKNIIFTSQETVRFFVEYALEANLNLHRMSAYCVGSKTAGSISDCGVKVECYFHYAADLAEYIEKRHAEKHFDFLCGNLRRDTLPEKFLKHGISFTETKLYQTDLVPHRWSQDFDVILFYSPSGVRSHMKRNELTGKELCLCIGTTTAAEAFKYTSRVKIAEFPTIEKVLESVKKEYLKSIL